MLLNEIFVSEEDLLIDALLSESASMAWGKRGGEIVKKYRCLSGPRKGRLVNTPGDCAKKLDLMRSKRMKRNIAVKGKRMARKAKRTKRVSPLSKQIQKRNLLMNDATQINEANVIGSAIYLKTIPAKYRQYEMIGKGATSVVFKKDENTVFIITRDSMKVDWLNNHDETQFIEELELDHPIRKMAEKPVYVYTMPMLYPLDKSNKRKVAAIIKKFQEIRNKTQRHADLINKLIELAEIEFAEQRHFNDFVGFIMNYDERQFYFDLHRRNFMQNANGDIIVTDPIVDKEIVDLFMKDKQLKLLHKVLRGY